MERGRQPTQTGTSEMAIIEAVAVAPAPPAAVWEALLDAQRWAEWRHDAAGAHLEAVEIQGPAFGQVGDRRRCTGLLTGLPLLRRRRVVWEEQVTDACAGRTLEVEAVARPGARGAIRRWRLRVWLVPHHAPPHEAQPDAEQETHTRLRCRLSYQPASTGGWVVDRLFLRRRIEDATHAFVTSLAASFGPAAEAEDEAAQEGHMTPMAPSDEAETAQHLVVEGPPTAAAA